MDVSTNQSFRQYKPISPGPCCKARKAVQPLSPIRDVCEDHVSNTLRLGSKDGKRIGGKKAERKEVEG